MRVAVVTGAANGIGRGIVAHLLDRDWSVVGMDIDAERLTGLASPWFVPHVGDVTDRDALRRAAEVAREHGDLLGWVNNAGITTVGRLDNVAEEVVDRTIAVDLRAVFDGCRVAVQAFLDTGLPGAIVNVSSIHARAAFPGSAAYDMAKGGVESLTRAVCVEYAHLGIRCNAVAPGGVATEAQMRALDGAADPEAVVALWRDLSPSRRVFEPSDIAPVVEFLLSDGARAVNGHVVAVDGGMAARAYPFPPDLGIEFGRSGKELDRR